MKGFSLSALGTIVGMLLLQACGKVLSPTPPDKIIASGRFSDGFVVEFLRTELTPKMSMERVVSGGLFGLRINSESGRTLDQGGFQLETRVRNGSLSEAKFSFQNNQEPVLMVLLRARRADGAALVNHHFLANGQCYEIERPEDKHIHISDARTATDDPAQMELHLQVEDGSGGWRDLLGPIMPDAEDGRAFAAVDAFPRRKPDLRLRAFHAGQAPIEVVVPNPGYQPSFPVLEAQTPPLTYESTEFRVFCDGLTWQSQPGRALTLAAQTRLEFPTLPKNSLRLTTRHFDETGNRLIYKMGRFEGVDPLPGEKLCRVECVVERDGSLYPWHEEEVTFVAEGVMASSPESQNATLTAEGKRLGCRSIAFFPPDVSQKSWQMNKPYVLDFEIRGECSAGELEAMQKDYEFGQMAVFVNGSRSTGECQRGRWGRGSHSGWANFDCHQSWVGDLKPGEAFRIALVKKHFPMTSEFVLILPERPAHADR